MDEQECRDRSATGGITRNSGQGPVRMGKVFTSLTVSPKTPSSILS